MKLVVAVTGGIGSGKSTAAKLFETLGAGLVDTDAIAHQLTQPGRPAVERIRKRFGDNYIDSQGALDRARMRNLVFSDTPAKRDLEAILHPLIRVEAMARVARVRAPYVLLVVPLLIETGGYRDLAGRVLVIDCSEQVQIERTISRSGLTEAQTRAIIASQASREQRLSAADDVIDNNAGLAELAEQVKALHARYVSLVSAG
jgi:dephospho-CoA kinase